MGDKDKKNGLGAASSPKIHVKDVPAPERYFNRELSWLEFNARVLEEAQDEATPLLERAKFLAILSKNLDEFAEVRVPRLMSAIETDDDKVDADGYRPHEVLELADKRIREIEAAANVAWESMVPLLAAKGIRVLRPAEWTGEHRAALDEAWAKVRPSLVLKPVPLAGAFPLLRTGQLFLAVGSPVGTTTHVVIFEGDPGRLVKLPAPPGQFRFALLEDVVKSRLGELVPGVDGFASSWLCRLSRDTNFMLNEEGQAELIQSIVYNAHNDAEDRPIRLQHETRAAASVVFEVARRHGLALGDLFTWGSFPDHRGLFGIAGLDLPALRDPVQPPLQHPVIAASKSMFEAIAREDVLLYHPFHSYDPVVRFVEEAAADPAVRALHATLYRTSSTSPIVAALVNAAKLGKAVRVLVEAKARFDEETNVQRARTLEAAGGKVSLGLKGLKTHGKAILVEREEGGRVRRYAHLGTGNYNEKSAKIYTDLSLFTCDDELTGELAQVFDWLEGGKRPEGKRHRVWNAPDLLRDKLRDLIRREADHAREGRPARIIAKMNAIADRELIEELYSAADAGVQVDLIIRGACTLRPGSGKVPSRLRARRVVDRYLEHARVLYFSDGFPQGGKPDVYLASADWMGRNLDKRVELMFKLRGDRFINEIRDYLELQLQDDVKGRTIERDGRSARVSPAPGKVRSQTALYEKLVRQTPR